MAGNRESTKEQYLAWWEGMLGESLDDLTQKIGRLNARWAQGSSYTQQAFSSGFGATLVAFVPTTSQLHRKIKAFLYFLQEDTEIGRAGRLKLNPLGRIHLTIRGLVSGRAEDLTSRQTAQLQEVVQHAVDSFERERPTVIPVVAFANDINISPSARINLMGSQLNGRPLDELSRLINEQIQRLEDGEATDLGLELGSRKGDHISLASLTDERVTQREFDDLRERLSSYREQMSTEGFGTLEIHRVTFVHHYDDLLDKCRAEHERSYVLGQEDS